MRARFYLVLAAAWSAPGLIARNAAAVDDDGLRAPRPPGRTLIYEGTSEMRQSTGGEAGDPTRLRATLILVDAPSGKPDDHDRLAIRAIVPSPEGDGGEPTGSARLLVRGANGALAPAEAALESEEAEHILGVFLPHGFDPPAATTEAVSRELRVLNRVVVEAQVVVVVEKTDAGVVHRSTLEGGKTVPFSFRDSSAKLTEWNETYHVGANGVLRARSITYAIEVDFDGTAVKLAMSNTLESKDTAGGEPGLAKALAAFLTVSAQLDARKPSTEISPQLEALEKATAGGPLAALAVAARSRLDGFVALFEADDAGKVLAKVLGAKAPDFTLDDLDGKSVSLHEASRGRVSLLVFWGVG